MRHTKIISTLGPASDFDPMLDALIAAGAAVVFININPDLTRPDANYLRIQRL